MVVIFFAIFGMVDDFMKILNDKRGLTFIEVLIGLILEGIIIGAIFLFMTPMNSFDFTAHEASDLQQYGNEVLDLIHSQIVKANHVAIYEKGTQEDKYENNLFCQNGALFLNNRALVSIKNYDITIKAEVTDTATIRVYVYIRDIKGNLKYDNSMEMVINFLEREGELPEGGESLVSNCVISYDTEELFGYDITAVAYTLRENMRKFAINWTLMTVQERKDAYNGVWYANNSTFRNELRKSKYDGVWPKLPRDKDGNYPFGIVSENDMYVQVYIHTPNNDDNSNADIIVFATTSQGDNWYTNLIYDHEEAQWYRRLRGGWSCNKPWSDVKEEIHSDRWIPVTT